jgi:hypothetical protein
MGYTKSSVRDLIICGCYRSGTTALAEVLSYHPQLVVTNEMWYYYTDHRIDGFNEKLKRLYDLSLKSNKRHFITDGSLTDNYNDFLKTIISQYPRINKNYFKNLLIQYSGKKPLYYGDKLPEYTFYINEFNKVYNKPKFIMCIRDPRDVMCSQLRRYKQLTAKFGSKKQHWWANATIKECINMNRNWYKYIQEWDSVKGRVDSYEVRYHNIIKDINKEARGLADFLGISYEPLKKVWLSKFNPSINNEWKRTYPNINKQLPTKWLKLMEQYGIEV